MLGFPFFFFSFCVQSAQREAKLNDSSGGTVELHTAPTPVPLKIMLKSKIRANIRVARAVVVHTTLVCSTACCEVNAVHILYPAFALKYCLLPPLLRSPSLFSFLSLYSPFSAKLLPGKSTNNAFMLIKLAPLLICLQFAFLASPGKKQIERERE